MAKSHGSKRGNTNTPSNNTASRRLLGPSLSSLILTTPLRQEPVLGEIPLDFFEERLEEVQDRRRYDPDPVRGAKRVTGYPARLRSLYRAPLQAIGFEDPKRVLVCVRRKTRREVLHAMRRTKKGSRARFKKRSYYSNVRC